MSFSFITRKVSTGIYKFYVYVHVYIIDKYISIVFI